MSTILYAYITKLREEEDDTGTRGAGGAGDAGGAAGGDTRPNVTTYVDTMAALVPTEALALHALALSAFTETTAPAGGEPADNTGGSEAAQVASPVAGTQAETLVTTDVDLGAATTITDAPALRLAFYVLLLATLGLYGLTHGWRSKPTRRRTKGWKGWSVADGGRILMPPIAFVLWTMLQPATAFDAVFPDFHGGQRFFFAAVVALFVGIAAQRLAVKAKVDKA